MDKYIRVARVYPAVLGILPICILLAMCMDEWFPQYQTTVGNVKWILCLVGGTATVSLAVGYLVRELFRETSKVLFQTFLFKIDEMEMPTTKMLLWQNEAISAAYHKEIAAKAKATFGIKLPTREEEQANPTEAKKTVVDAVSQIRQHTREDLILRQYNMEFGFCRNYLGAGVWSIVFILGLGIANIFHGWLPWWALAVSLILQVLLMVCCIKLLNIRGWAYAKYLYATFTGKNNNKH